MEGRIAEAAAMREVQCGARQIGLRLQGSSADICSANIRSSPEFAAVAIHLLKEPFVARGRFDGTEAFNMHGHPAQSARWNPTTFALSKSCEDEIVVGIFHAPTKESLLERSPVPTVARAASRERKV